MKTNKVAIEYLEKIASFLVLLMPISIAVGRGVADTNLSAVAVLFLVYLFLRRDFSFFKEGWVKASLLFWFYLIVNSLFRENYLVGLSKTVPFIRFIFFALCFQFVVARQGNLDKKLLVILSVIVCFLVIDGYIQYFWGRDIFGRQKIFDHMGNYQYYRLTGPFSKRVLGAVLMILSPVVLSFLLFKIKESPKKNMVLVLPIILIEVIIFLTGERAALIQSCFALAILFVYIYRSNINIFFLFGGTLCVLVSLYLVIPNDLLVRHWDSVRILKMGSESAYGMLWKSSVLMGLDNPLFGVGGGNFQESCRGLVSFCNYHSHNVYLEMFSEFGLVGLVLFCALLFFIFRDICLVLKMCRGRYNLVCVLAVGIGAAVFVKLLPFLPSSGFFKNWYAVPLWFMVGWMQHLKMISKSNSVNA